MRLVLIIAIVLRLHCAWCAPISPPRLSLLRGTLHLAEGQAAAAVADLRQAAQAMPEDAPVQQLYGEALLQDGQSLLGKAVLRRATLLAPSRPEPWQALLAAGTMSDDTALVNSALNGLARILPDDPRLQRRMAEFARRQGRIASADKLTLAYQNSLPPLKLNFSYSYRMRPATLPELRELSHDDPENIALLAALGCLEWRADNPDNAREAFRQWYQRAPQDRTAIGNYTYACLTTGQTAEALTALEAAAPLGDITFDRSLALWSLADGQYERAVAPLRRLLAREPVDATLNRLLGTAHWLAGDAEAACVPFRIAWLRAHDQLTAQHYAQALFAAHNATDAEDLLENAIELFPEESMLRVVLVLLYRDTDRLQQAAQLTAELAYVRPERIELLLLATERYTRAGYITKAFPLAGELRAAGGKDPLALYAAVQSYRLLGATTEAHLTLIRNLGPNQPSPLPWEAIMLEVAGFAAEDNRLNEAVTALEEILKRNPASRPALTLLGKLYVQQGVWSEAVRVYTAALQQWPDDAEFTLQLARAARQGQNYPLALKSYERVAARYRVATPWLERGEIYRMLGEEARAQQCWEQALLLPGGAIAGRLRLLASYEAAGDKARVAETLAQVLHDLTAARTARRSHWQEALTRRGLAPTADELDTLLLFEPDLADPAPLLARQAALDAETLPAP